MPVSFVPSIFMVLSVLSLSADAVLRYSIFEKLETNSFVADINHDARLLEDYNKPAGAELKFTLLPGSHDQYFMVMEASGVLVIKSFIDRDSLCSEISECVLFVEVAIIRPVESFRVFPVEITIEDINDHFPTFDYESWTMSIPENAIPRDTAYPIPVARDLDSQVYSVVRYTLSSASDHPFSVQVLTSPDGLQMPYLRLNGRLDREIMASYSLVVNAYDGDVMPKSASLDVTVIVADVNDNSPVFELSEYNVTISENVQVPAVIAKVVAADEDDGINSIVSYHMISPSKELYSALFQINNITGEVSLIKRLDFNYRDVYSLILGASDHGDEPRTSTVKLYVRVLDVNTHSPNLTINSLTKSGRPEVLENQPPGTFVSYASVLDLDRGQNGKVSCLSLNSDFTLLLMHSRTYKIVTAAAFDREQDDLKKLVVECTDGGTPPLKSVLEIDVLILDENDNVPLFEIAHYEASVMENTVVGQSILTVSASDRDVGINAEVVYVLNSANLPVMFELGTNVIVAKQNIDYETTPEIKFEITAFNRVANSSMSSAMAASVVIYVHNENDCAPTFTQTLYRFGVFENMPASTDVGTVSAVDCDAPPFNEFYYQLAAYSKTASSFSVDPHSGRISTRAMLDREAIAVHYFSVWVTDAHNLSVTSSTNVTVYVADRNDNTPEITFPVSGNEVLYLSPHSPLGHILAVVRAVDADVGINSQLLYNLSSSSERSLFDIDTHTGTISVSRSLVAMENKSLKLRITVSDLGTPRLSTSAVLNVQINDSSSDAQLVFQQPKARTAKVATFVSHLQILMMLGALTTVLVIVIVAAIVWIRCCRNPSTVYSNPDKLSPDYFTESKPEQTMNEFRNGQFSPSSRVAKESMDMYDSINTKEFSDFLRPKITKFSQPKASKKKQPAGNTECAVAHGTGNFSTSSLPLRSDKVNLSQSSNTGILSTSSSPPPPSSRFHTLAYCQGPDHSLTPSSSSSSLYDVQSECENNPQNSKLLTTFLPPFPGGSSSCQTKERTLREEVCDRPTDSEHSEQSDHLPPSEQSDHLPPSEQSDHLPPSEQSDYLPPSIYSQVQSQRTMERHRNSANRHIRCKESSLRSCRPMREPLLSKHIKTLDRFPCQNCDGTMQKLPVIVVSETSSALDVVSPATTDGHTEEPEADSQSPNMAFRIKTPCPANTK